MLVSNWSRHIEQHSSFKLCDIPVVTVRLLNLWIWSWVMPLSLYALSRSCDKSVSLISSSLSRRLSRRSSYSLCWSVSLLCLRIPLWFSLNLPAALWGLGLLLLLPLEAAGASSSSSSSSISSSWPSKFSCIILGFSIRPSMLPRRSWSSRLLLFWANLEIQVGTRTQTRRRRKTKHILTANINTIM